MAALDVWAVTALDVWGILHSGLVHSGLVHQLWLRLLGDVLLGLLDVHLAIGLRRKCAWSHTRAAGDIHDISSGRGVGNLDLGKRRVEQAVGGWWGLLDVCEAHCGMVDGGEQKGGK